MTTQDLGAVACWDETRKDRAKGNSVQGVTLPPQLMELILDRGSNEDSVSVKAESSHTATRQQQTL